MKTPRRVDEHEVGACGLGALDRVVAHACRVAAAFARDHLDVRAARPHLELLDGGGAERVGRTEDHPATRLGGLLSDLAHRGGLARAVDAHEEHERLIVAEDVLPARRERVGDVVAQQIEHRVRVGKRLTARLIAQALHDVIRRCAADVAQDERLLKAVPKILVEVGPAVEQDVHRLLELVARTREPRADALEKSHMRVLTCRRNRCAARIVKQVPGTRRPMTSGQVI